MSSDFLKILALPCRNTSELGYNKNDNKYHSHFYSMK